MPKTNESSRAETSLMCAKCGHANKKASPFCMMCGEPFGAEGPAPKSPAVEKPAVDKPEQVSQVKEWLLPSEQLHAIFDCRGPGAGFVAITDKRLFFRDKAAAGSRKRTLTSVPFSRVTSVSSVDEGGPLRVSSQLTVRVAGDDLVFEFAGGDTAQRAYMLIMRGLLEADGRTA
jgi:hypothetical protein